LHGVWPRAPWPPARSVAVRVVLGCRLAHDVMSAVCASVGTGPPLQTARRGTELIRPVGPHLHQGTAHRGLRLCRRWYTATEMYAMTYVPVGPLPLWPIPT
jgi:hypothetical protein